MGASELSFELQPQRSEIILRVGAFRRLTNPSKGYALFRGDARLVTRLIADGQIAVSLSSRLVG
jgi:hypothetical protein